jgi:hypothetical protein
VVPHDKKSVPHNLLRALLDKFWAKELNGFLILLRINLLLLREVLVWWHRSSQYNSNVNPGNPGSESGIARPGIQNFCTGVWHTPVPDAGFRRYDAKESKDLFNKLLRHHAS